MLRMRLFSISIIGSLVLAGCALSEPPAACSALGNEFESTLADVSSAPLVFVALGDDEQERDLLRENRPEGYDPNDPRNRRSDYTPARERGDDHDRRGSRREEGERLNGC